MPASDHHPFAVETAGEFLGAWLAGDFLEGDSKAVFNRYYSSYIYVWDNYIQNHYTRQLDPLVELIAASGRLGFTLLDLGCGCGTEALWLAYRTGAQVTGVDLRADRLRVAEKRLDILQSMTGEEICAEFSFKNFLDMDESEKFDAIWMEQAFHHLEPRSKAIDKIVELLNPAGHVVISEPNAWNPLVQLNFFRKRGFKTIKEFVDEDGIRRLYGDERILTPFTMKRAFTRRGVATRLIEYFRLLPNKRWARAFAGLEQMAPSWFFPVFTHYTYVGQKTDIR